MQKTGLAPGGSGGTIGERKLAGVVALHQVLMQQIDAPDRARWSRHGGRGALEAFVIETADRERSHRGHVSTPALRKLIATRMDRRLALGREALIRVRDLISGGTWDEATVHDLVLPALEMFSDTVAAEVERVVSLLDDIEAARPVSNAQLLTSVAGIHAKPEQSRLTKRRIPTRRRCESRSRSRRRSTSRRSRSRASADDDCGPGPGDAEPPARRVARNRADSAGRRR